MRLAEIVGNALRTLMTSVLSYDPHPYLHGACWRKSCEGRCEAFSDRGATHPAGGGGGVDVRDVVSA